MFDKTFYFCIILNDLIERGGRYFRLAFFASFFGNAKKKTPLVREIYILSNVKGINKKVGGGGFVLKIQAANPRRFTLSPSKLFINCKFLSP